VVDPGSLAVFLVAVSIICVTPGPDMLFILSRGLTFGTRAGLLSALGMSGGMIVHTTAVSLGLAAVLKSSPAAYDVLRYAGAAYLLLMAYRSLRDASKAARAEGAPGASGADDAESPAEGAGTARSGAKMFGQAVLTNVLNPKIVLFYLAFLPQFVRPSAGRPALQLLVLGLVFTAVGLLVDSAVALLAGRIGRWLQRRGNGQVWMGRVSGVVLAGLAARVAL
jgi:threonine/homoserine/homoserine lactone efflux protein